MKLKILMKFVTIILIITKCQNKLSFGGAYFFHYYCNNRTNNVHIFKAIYHVKFQVTIVYEKNDKLFLYSLHVTTDKLYIN